MSTNRKKCRSCGKRKMYIEYYKKADMLDGHSNICKECHKERQRNYNEGYLRPRRYVRISKLSDTAMCDRCKFRPTCDVRVRQTDEEHWDWMPPCFVTSHLHDAYVKEYGNGAERVQV